MNILSPLATDFHLESFIMGLGVGVIFYVIGNIIFFAVMRREVNGDEKNERE